MVETIANVLVECEKCHARPADPRTHEPKPMPAYAAAAWKRTHEERFAMDNGGIALHTANIRGRATTWAEPLNPHRVRVDVML